VAAKGFVIKGFYFDIGDTPTELSDYIISMDGDISLEEVDATTSTDEANALVMARLAGTQDYQFNITLAQDLTATTGVDAVIWGKFDAKAAVAFNMRPKNAAQSTTNPTYHGHATIFNYNPFASGIGQHATCTISLKCSDGEAMTRTAT
jgi:hypothetical protein